MRDGKGVKGVAHSEPCRKRVENCLREDGDPRFQQPVDAVPEERSGAAGSSTGATGMPAMSSTDIPGAHAGKPARPLDPPSGTGHHADEQTEELEEPDGEDAKHPYKWWAEEEMAVEPDADDADMLALSRRGMPAPVAQEYLEVYELLLIHGTSVGDARKKVSELFSPPRVTAELQRTPTLNLAAGMTYDLREDEQGRTWNFLNREDRVRARKEIREMKPFMVIGSPLVRSSAS
jgi:hypothetical protein